MAIAMESYFCELLQPTGYELFAEFKYGSNGDFWGPAELAAGEPAGSFVTGRMTWDNNIYNGFDTQWRQVSLVAHAGDSSSTLEWAVGDQTLVYEAPAYDYFEDVTICAGVDGQALVAWSALQVQFYSQGTLVDSWYVTSGPRVNRLDNTTPGQGERVLQIIPEYDYVDEIRVDAMVLMKAPQGVYLDANSVFGQVLINAA